MRTLGVILGGGQSSRFGSDKALATFAGRPLIDHALETLAQHSDAVATAGRAHGDLLSIPDHPEPGLGPLGGLSGALHYALDNGFDRVLTCGVDCLAFPAELLRRAPAFFDAQPVIGLWPARLADALDTYLATDPRRSVRGFAASVGAIPIRAETLPANINTPDDLAKLEQSHLEHAHGL